MSRSTVILLFFVSVPLFADSVLRGEVYPLDRDHSALTFSVTLGGLTDVRGTFGRWDGALYFDETDATRSSVVITIDITTVDTGNAQRDDHLRTDDFFAAESHPIARFESTRIARNGDRFSATGPLKIRGATRNVTVPVMLRGKGVDPFQNRRITLATRFTIDRHDFDVVGPAFWNQAIGDDVDIDIVASFRIFNFNNAFSPKDPKRLSNQLVAAIEIGGLDAARTILADRDALPSTERTNDLQQTTLAAARLIQSERVSEGHALLKIALTRHADDEGLAGTYRWLAIAETEEGHRDEAIASASKVLELDPDDLYAQQLLRRLQAAATE